MMVPDEIALQFGRGIEVGRSLQNLKEFSYICLESSGLLTGKLKSALC